MKRHQTSVKSHRHPCQDNSPSDCKVTNLLIMAKFLLVILVLGIFYPLKNVEGGPLPSHRLFAEVHFTNFYITSSIKVVFTICCKLKIHLCRKNPNFAKSYFCKNQQGTLNSTSYCMPISADSTILWCH